MDAVLSVLTLGLIGIHLTALVAVRLRTRNTSSHLYWLLATIVLALLTVATYLLPIPADSAVLPLRGILLAFGTIGLLGAYGVSVIDDMAEELTHSQARRWWLMLIGAWAGGMLIAMIIAQPFTVGTRGWLLNLFDAFSLSAIVMVLGLGAAGSFLVITNLMTFYNAYLPEIANRAILWVLDAAVIIIGALLIITADHSIGLIGSLFLLLGIGGAAYAQESYRVFDIRRRLLYTIRTFMVVGVAWVLIFVSTYVMISSDLATDGEGLLIIAGLSLIVAALYVPIRQFAELFAERLMSPAAPDTAQVTREYSRVVSEAMELNTLVNTATSALNHLMRVRHSGLILMNSTARVANAVELIVMYPDVTRSELRGTLNVRTTVYHTLAIGQKAVTQFDLEYGPKYQDMSDEERAFFKKLDTSAYVPIILENVLIGILGVGPKVNDSAFYPRDLELLSTLAQQTGVALRNTRLVEDLQHLNKNMRSLNEKLKSTNDQLARMDSVKTDFVTIASHELRTPLAQIRGYTDITDALNEQGMLDKDQISTMISNLRKAIDRTEELISAMLDVSQLDVDAMDLHLTPTSALSVVTMAIEPLSEAITQRKLSVSAKGLKGLPTIYADLQRMVQAFRNVIVNAIKFTPDGGLIMIEGELQEPDDLNGMEYIQVKITDTGVGIDPQNLEMVFKKFFRAYDPSLHSTGTYKFMGAGPGLGLTIARGVIEGHGGKIWSESEGHDMQALPGATFYIVLPVTPPESARRTLTFEGEMASQAVEQIPTMANGGSGSAD